MDSVSREDLSKAAAAGAIGCTTVGVRWLLFCDALTGSFSEANGNLVETVEWLSVEDYLQWRDAASPGQRRLRSLRNVVMGALHPVMWVLRVFEIISPG